MKARLLAASLLLAAGAVWMAWGRPLRQETLSLADEYRRLRDERRQLETGTARERRSGVARQQALASLISSRGAVLPNARRAALKCLAETALGEVRLGVKAGKLGSSTEAAQVHIQGTGSFSEVIKLTDQLTESPNLFILEQVSFTPRGERIEVAIEAWGVGGNP